jgi:phosphohistidine phosphatase
MAEQLIIARHGKSSWDYEAILDIDRPLAIRGITDSIRMAERMKSRGHIPSLIITSPAIRAIHTAVIFARVLNLSWEQLRIEEKIYPGSPEDILDLLEQVDDRYPSVMIFGHNPAFTELANHFLTHRIDNIPTAGMVILDFTSGNWKEIRNLKSQNELFDFPKK